MTSNADLPAELRAWSTSLAALSPDLAVAIGPMVLRLAGLFDAQAAGAGREVSFDGYAGLSTHGDPARLLASEWLLADEVPLEFLRRAATGELLHLAPALRENRLRGRVAVLVDSGPEQLGAGRLVQLAALVVLHRRAAARNTELVVGVLGEPAGRWSTGELAEVLPYWLTNRTSAESLAGDVARWADVLDAPDEAWLLTGPRLSAAVPGRRRVLSSAVAGWDADGARTVRVSFEGTTIELPLPDRHRAVQALRGAEFRRLGPEDNLADAAGSLRFPSFPSVERKLLARREGPDEIAVVTVPQAGARAGRLRRHRFPGPVLAASSLGRRLVVLYAEQEHDRVRVRVVGKPLGHLNRLSIPFAAVHLDGHAVDRITTNGLPPLYFHSGDLLCPLPGTWWRLSPDPGHPPRVEAFLAVGPTGHADRPHTVTWRDGGLHSDDHEIARGAPAGAAVVLGAQSRLAWSPGGEIWFPIVDGHRGDQIVVEPGARVVAMVTIEGTPWLVTVSPGGLVVRLVAADGIRTLTRWSGTPEGPVVHPRLNLLAVRRSDGAVEVGDLTSDRPLLVLRGAG